VFLTHNAIASVIRALGADEHAKEFKARFDLQPGSASHDLAAKKTLALLSKCQSLLALIPDGCS
jgi:hypothetical protein